MWVILLGSPLECWHREVFEVVGNVLGHFLHVEEDVLRGDDKRVGYMLVEEDIYWGLVAKLEIN